MKVENSSLAKAAVGKPSSQMRNEQLRATVCEAHSLLPEAITLSFKDLCCWRID